MADPDGHCARKHLEAGTAGRNSNRVRALPAKSQFFQTLLDPHKLYFPNQKIPPRTNVMRSSEAG